MSFIKKGLASIGIGGAKVDTKVYDPRVKVGEYIEGDIVIKGGNVDQDINDVTICVRSLYEKEVDDKKISKSITHQEYTVNINKTIAPKETLNIPFKFKISGSVPLSTRKHPVFLQTQLDISSAVDNFDKDYIEVLPNEYMENIIEGIKELGFSLRSIESEYINSTKYFQEYEFLPRPGSEFKRYLDELELVMKPNEYGVSINLEVDRKARGLGGILENMMNMDESQLKFNFTNDELRNLNHVKSQLYSIIQKYAR